MIRLVQSADAGKAKIVGLADRWATWIVVVGPDRRRLDVASSPGDPIRAVTILVVFCPCALVLATPTAIMAAIGNATRHSFLVREGDALERLASVSQVTFDKTGTLTLRHPPGEAGGEPAAGRIPGRALRLDCGGGAPVRAPVGPCRCSGLASRDRRGAAGDSGLPDAPRPGCFVPLWRVITSSPVTGSC